MSNLWRFIAFWVVFEQLFWSVSSDQSAVVQHPMMLNVAAPSAMMTPPPMSPLKTRVVVVHNNMVPVPIECFQPPDSGTCSKDLARIYYDHETRTCKPFSYTGCGGNANRFQSIKNCYRICHPYRYKIRPKVAHHPKPVRALRVKALPSHQMQGLGHPQPFPSRGMRQGYGGGGAGGYGGGYAPYAQPGFATGYGGFPGQQQFGGRPNQPIYEKQAVMSPSGPKVKHQLSGKTNSKSSSNNSGKVSVK